jgi:hypothetical protein
MSPDETDFSAQPRRFGYWTGHFVVMACMIGAGILSARMSPFSIIQTTIDTLARPARK